MEDTVDEKLSTHWSLKSIYTSNSILVTYGDPRGYEYGEIDSLMDG